MSVQNAKSFPEVYYGLHFCEGVAEYAEPQKEPYRIFINNDVMNSMNPSFAGKPVYVQHVEEVDLDNLQEEADGYVSESFFNAADGKHWAKFIAVSDKAKEAIKNKWKLSNSYTPKRLGNGGEWHGVSYIKEILEGEYDHLAIVPNPRYAESIILTPDEFKEYNAEKELELKKLANAKEKGETSMLSIFKRTKVDNAADYETMSVVLPKSKKEKTISQIVNEADEHEMEKDKQLANGEHHVMVGNDKMMVNDLVKKYMDMKNELEEMKKKPEDKKPNDDDADDKKPNDDADPDAEAKKKALELAKHEEEELAAKKKNDEEVAKKKEEDEKAANKKKNFDNLKNADKNTLEQTAKVELSEDQTARGRSRYGSDA